MGSDAHWLRLHGIGLPLCAKRIAGNRHHEVRERCRGDQGRHLRFYLRDAIGGKGEAYASIKVYYDPKIAINDWEWSPATCVSAAQGIEDGTAKGELACTDMPEVDVEGCAMMNGARVCPEDMKSPVNGLSPLCRAATVNATFDYYQGQQDCWTGVDSTTVCPPKNEGGNLDECQELVNQGCTWVKTQCTEGAEGQVHKDNCYVNTVTYDCGKDITV